MKNTLLEYLRYLMISMLIFTFNVGVALDKTSRHTVRLSGHVPNKAVSQAIFIEPLSTNSPIPITFILPLRNQKALEQLIQQIYNPADQQHYGKYLTSAEFIERFAPAQEDYDTVIAYAKKLGLNIISTHPNRKLLKVSGHSKSIEAAFNLNLHTYQHTDGRKFHAPDNEPEVSVDIASIINGIVGLDNFPVYRTYNRRKEMSKKMLNALNPSSFPSGPGGGYTPADIKTAYNLNGVSANGFGQTIALVEFATYQMSDISAYTTYFGLPSPNLINILVDGGADSTIGSDEVTLDIEFALALAPQSRIYVYESPNNLIHGLHLFQQIATDNIAKQVSTSWGLGEDLPGMGILNAENQIFQQMAVQGQTIYAASGDNGAYGNLFSTNLVVVDPASQPYVVGVGGTSLTVKNTGAYVNETVWNQGNGASGGGVSGHWTIPSWQTNVATVYSHTNRNVPDISLNADTNPGYSFFFNGGWAIAGGTSCAAPLWAAFTALVNQQRQATQMSPLGFANPQFYAIGTSAASAAMNYHDITRGNNYFYNAGLGYDNATGWGSFNGANLFASLTQPIKDIPTVGITSPANGAAVSGTINITANAASLAGIAYVNFYVDGILIVSDNTLPYTATLNTTTLSNGYHIITTTAYNNVGDSAQSVVTVTVNNIE